MNFTEKYTKVFKALLPTPFTIAVVLTLLTFLLALFFTRPTSSGMLEYSFDLMGHWEKGLGAGGGLAFALQMMLMLVLGHVLALSKPIDKLLNGMIGFCNNTAVSALFVTFITIVFSLMNWGLGLILGALFARKIAERSIKKGFSINYPLIGAAGYSGLMVWHGGLSGSAPLKIAENNGIKNLYENYTIAPELAAKLPDSVSVSETLFSPINLTVAITLVLVIPISMYFIGKRVKDRPIALELRPEETNTKIKVTGAERLDYSRVLCMTVAIIILNYLHIKAFSAITMTGENFINPNFINLLLLGLGLLLHQRFSTFLNSVDAAVGGAAGILIQFPLYFGILGLMKGSGMMTDISTFFVSHTNETTHPIFTFLSAGLVNILVPSGGGQWAVQGPIIIESSIQQGFPLGKGIMAMSYGDQLTNMLQPFWALPLLAITGLKAKEILPYTLFIMLIGMVIFISGLLIF
ncbi:MAG: short-chain fatty acid transporter [Flavobacteriales bacterium]|nr:short-chain fatty acid transporter [Flavobacteriales bacterium]